MFGKRKSGNLNAGLLGAADRSDDYSGAGPSRRSIQAAGFDSVASSFADFARDDPPPMAASDLSVINNRRVGLMRCNLRRDTTPQTL